MEISQEIYHIITSLGLMTFGILCLIASGILKYKNNSDKHKTIISNMHE